MNKHYVLTPIGEVEGLKTGWYYACNTNKEILSNMIYFVDGDWHEPLPAYIPYYLRPITDGIVISEEEFRKELNSAWSQGAYLNSPTDYINLIISKYKDNGK